MSYRKTPLVEGQIYHIFTKSIAGFKIFNSRRNYQRLLNTAVFYTRENPPDKFSMFQRKNPISYASELGSESTRIVRIIAFCIMPTHIHLILEQLKKNGISRFINLILKSYSKYFNEKYKRKGPLWEGRFKNVLVNTQEQFLHLTRYIHLNPLTASLVNAPQDWEFSSYKEYIGLIDTNRKICDFSNYLDMNENCYEKFVLGHIEYQKHLALIKHLILE